MKNSFLVVFFIFNASFVLLGENYCYMENSLSRFYNNQIKNEIDEYWGARRPNEWSELNHYVQQADENFKIQLDDKNPLSASIYKKQIEGIWLDFVGNEFFKLGCLELYHRPIKEFPSEEDLIPWIATELGKLMNHLSIKDLCLNQKLSEKLSEKLRASEFILRDSFSPLYQKSRFIPMKRLNTPIHTQNQKQINFWRDEALEKFESFQQDSELELERLRRSDSFNNEDQASSLETIELVLEEGINHYLNVRNEGIELGLEKFTMGRNELELRKEEWFEKIDHTIEEQKKLYDQFLIQTNHSFQQDQLYLSQIYDEKVKDQRIYASEWKQLIEKNQQDIRATHQMIQNIYAQNLKPYSGIIEPDKFEGEDRNLLVAAQKRLKEALSISQALEVEEKELNSNWIAQSDINSFSKVSYLSTESYINAFYKKAFNYYQYLMPKIMVLNQSEDALIELDKIIDNAKMKSEDEEGISFLSQFRELLFFQRQVAENSAVAKEQEAHLVQKTLLSLEQETKRLQQEQEIFQKSKLCRLPQENLTEFLNLSKEWEREQEKLAYFQEFLALEKEGKEAFSCYHHQFKTSCDNLFYSLFVKEGKNIDLKKQIETALINNHQQIQDKNYAKSVKAKFYQENQDKNFDFSLEGFTQWFESIQGNFNETISEYLFIYNVIQNTSNYQYNDQNNIEAKNWFANLVGAEDGKFLGQFQYEIDDEIGRQINSLFANVLSDNQFHYFYQCMQLPEFRTLFTNQVIPYQRKLIIDTVVKEYHRLDDIMDKLCISAMATPGVGTPFLAIPLGVYYDYLNRLGQWLDLRAKDYTGQNQTSLITKTQYKALESEITKEIKELNKHSENKIDKNKLFKTIKNEYKIDYSLYPSLTQNFNSKEVSEIQTQLKNNLEIFREINEKLKGKVPSEEQRKKFIFPFSDYQKKCFNDRESKSYLAFDKTYRSYQHLKELNDIATEMDSKLSIKKIEILNVYAPHSLQFAPSEYQKYIEAYNAQPSKEKLLQTQFSKERLAYQQLLTSLHTTFKDEREDLVSYFSIINQCEPSQMILNKGNLFKGDLVFSEMKQLLERIDKKVGLNAVLELNECLLAHTLNEKNDYMALNVNKSLDYQLALYQEWNQKMDSWVLKGEEEWLSREVELENMQAQWMVEFETTINQLEKEIKESVKEGVRYVDLYQLGKSDSLFDDINQNFLSNIESMVDSVDFDEGVFHPFILTSPKSQILIDYNQQQIEKEFSMSEIDSLRGLKSKLDEQNLEFEREIGKAQLLKLWEEFEEMITQVDSQAGESLEGRLLTAGFQKEDENFIRQAITGQTLFQGTIAEYQRIGAYEGFDLSPYENRFHEKIDKNLMNLVEINSLFQDKVALLENFSSEIFGTDEQEPLMKVGHYDQVCLMDGEEFFHRERIQEKIEEQNREGDHSHRVSLAQNSDLLNKMDAINKYVLHHEIEFRPEMAGGKWGRHLGWEPQLIPNLTWAELSKKLKDSNSIVSLSNLRKFAFIQNLEGEGEMGRIIGDLSIYNMKQDVGLGEMREAFWNLRMWDDEGSIFKAISLKEAVDMALQVIITGLTFGTSAVSSWAWYGLSTGIDALFAIGDSIEADNNGEVAKIWTDFFISSSTSAITKGIGAGFDNAAALNPIEGVDKFFFDLAEEGTVNLIGGTLNGVQNSIDATEEGLVWNSQKAINNFFGKEKLGQTIGRIGGNLVSGGLDLMDTDGFKNVELNQLQETNQFIGTLTNVALEGVLAQKIDLSLLNWNDLTKGKFNGGILKLHLGEDGVELGLSSEGHQIHLKRWIDAGKGMDLYHQMNQINRLNYGNWSGKNRDLREILSLINHRGDDEIKRRFRAILNGKDKLLFEEGVDFYGKTVKEGDSRITTINSELRNELYEAIFLHELYRDGMVNSENKSETNASALSHLFLAYNSKNLDPILEEERELFEQSIRNGNINGFFDFLANYDSSNDYWKLLDNQLWFDGKEDLSAFSTGAKLVEVASAVSVEQALVQFMGREQLEQQMGKSALSMNNLKEVELQKYLQMNDDEYKQYLRDHKRWGKLELGHDSLSQRVLGFLAMKEFGYNYNFDKKEWSASNPNSVFTLSDKIKEGIVISNELNEKNEFDKRYAEMTLYRDYDSYRGTLGLIRNPGPEDNRCLDSILLEIKDLKGDLIRSEVYDGVQSVDVFNHIDKYGLDREQATPNGVEGNTIVSDRFDFKYLGKDSSLFYLANGTTLDGDIIDEWGSDGEAGGRWCVHADPQFYHSDGCFIMNPNDLAMMKKTLEGEGWHSGYQDFKISGKLRHKNDMTFSHYEMNGNDYIRDINEMTAFKWSGLSPHLIGKELAGNQKGKKKLKTLEGNEVLIDWTNLESDSIKTDVDKRKILLDRFIYYGLDGIDKNERKNYRRTYQNLYPQAP